jgi:N-acetylglucosamine kinase-like BadF-type ATPase
MTVVLGVEGGGSHTHAVVADADGHVLGAGGSDDPSNWEDVGIGAASAAIRAVVREALDGAGGEPRDVDAAVFGLAGVDFPIDEERLSGIPDALGLTGHASIVNDGFVALRAGTDDRFGVVVVAGTGSVVAGRNPSGEVFRTLGMGPTFGDWGSASEISAAAVTAVADAYLGRGPQTALSRLLCEKTGVESVVDFLEGTGRGRIDDTTFSPLVAQAADAGDECAKSILTSSGDRLGTTASHVVRMLGMQDDAFDVVLAGGIFRSRSADLMTAIEGAIRSTAPHARLVPLDMPPVVGCVLLAMEEAGSGTPPGLREALGSDAASALGIGRDPTAAAL